MAKKPDNSTGLIASRFNSTNLVAGGFNSTGPHSSGFDEFVEDEGIDLRHYWRVILRHKWGILALVFAVGLVTTVWAFSLQPVYLSTATLLIGGNEAVTVSNTTDPQSRLVNQANFLRTQHELLKSRKVAQSVLEQLGPDRAVILTSMETGSESGFNWRDWVPQSWLELVDKTQPHNAEFDPDDDLIYWLRDGLGVSTVLETSLVMVSLRHSIRNWQRGSPMPIPVPTSTTI